MNYLFVDIESNRESTVWKSMHEIGCTIDRIDNPHRVFVEVDFIDCRLFTYEAIH